MNLNRSLIPLVVAIATIAGCSSGADDAPFADSTMSTDDARAIVASLDQQWANDVALIELDVINTEYDGPSDPWCDEMRDRIRNTPAPTEVPDYFVQAFEWDRVSRFDDVCVPANLRTYDHQLLVCEARHVADLEPELCDGWLALDLEWLARGDAPVPALD